MCAVGAELVDALAQLLASGGVAVPEPGVVDRAALAALRRRAVVRHEDHERVVPFAELLDEREDCADLRVGVREESREALHEPSRDLLVLGLQAVPRRHPVRAG